jgi:SAM-dependent methyltransferase
MEDGLTEKLLALNRSLYTSLAEPFSATRFREQRGYRRLLPLLPQPCTLLDLGCGNGRWAAFLDSQGLKVRYVGVDFSPQMIDLARERTSACKGVQAEFLVADISQPNWVERIPALRYDVVSAMATIHHLPGTARRRTLVRHVRNLLPPGGLFIISTWQFTATKRMRRKIVPWQTIGVADQQVEPGDYLLDWRGGGNALRYCHLIDEQEIHELAADTGFTVCETFRSDGREGNLSLYAVLERPSSDRS